MAATFQVSLDGSTVNGDIQEPSPAFSRHMRAGGWKTCPIHVNSREEAFIVLEVIPGSLSMQGTGTELRHISAALTHTQRSIRPRHRI